MRQPDWKTCAGYLSAIATLALSLPGVQAVRADDDAIGVVSLRLVAPETTCDPTSEAGAATSVTVVLDDSADAAEGPRTIALDTQGYSYRPPAVDPEARRLERR